MSGYGWGNHYALSGPGMGYGGQGQEFFRQQQFQQQQATQAPMPFHQQGMPNFSGPSTHHWYVFSNPGDYNVTINHGHGMREIGFYPQQAGGLALPSPGININRNGNGILQVQGASPSPQLIQNQFTQTGQAAPGAPSTGSALVPANGGNSTSESGGEELPKVETD